MTSIIGSDDAELYPTLAADVHSTYDATFVSESGGAADEDHHQRISTTDQTLTVIYLLIGAIGLLGNAFVILVIFQYTAMRRSLTNLFIINQSFVDGFAAVILLLTTVFQDEGARLAGVGGDIYCVIWLSKSLLWGVLTTSTFNLLAMTFERFFAIVHPLRHKLHITRAKVVVSIVIAWVMGILFNGSILWPTTKVVNHQCNVLRFWPNVLVQRAVSLFNIAVKFVFPLVILCYCYLRMTVALKAKVHPATHQANTSDHSESIGMAKKEKARRNIFKTLTIITICFALCWFWNQVYFIIFNFGYALNFTNNFYHFSVVAVYFNCCCNPFIYIIHYRQFQDGVKKLKNRLYKPNAVGILPNSQTHSSQRNTKETRTDNG